MINSPMTKISPTVNGTVASFAVTPALPAGVSLDPNSGVISGAPQVLAAAAKYTITASNAAGSATATISIQVVDLPPVIQYPAPKLSLTLGVATRSISPTSTGGAVVSWNITPDLPAGLSFDTTSGIISGTPTAPLSGASYQITASNSGGHLSVTLTLSTAAAPLLDLGHATAINYIYSSGSRVLSRDSDNHWALWDYGAGTEIASGESACVSPPNGIDCTSVVTTALAGGTVAIRTPTGFDLRSSVDGSRLSALAISPAWWMLASDGSYFCAGDKSGLTAWAPSGTVLFSRSGDYSQAVIFAAPSQIRVAGGAAGQNVIETLSVPAGGSAVSSAFQGSFQSWFLDGARFLAVTGNTVRVYSSAAAQQEIAALGSVAGLTGQGNWFWTYSSNSTALQIYAVGGGATAAATFTLNVSTVIIPSGSTIGLIDAAGGPQSLIDLSGAAPVKRDFPTPQYYPSAFAPTSASGALFGNRYGVMQEAQVSGSPRNFSLGAAWSIAGSDARFALATASGSVMYFDGPSGAPQGTIPFLSSKVLIAADGSALAAEGGAYDQYYDDRTIKVFSLPAMTVIESLPYSFSSYSSGAAIPFDITFSASGTVLGQVLRAMSQASREVTSVPAATPIWSDSGNFLPLRLSPDGSLIAAQAMATNSPFNATDIIKSGVLQTAVIGNVVGWLDNSRLIVNQYQQVKSDILYRQCALFDPAGNSAGPCGLPELTDFQDIDATSVYSQAPNQIITVATGAPVWASGSPSRGVGAISSGHVIFTSGPLVLRETY